jgi:hypothetical protein
VIEFENLFGVVDSIIVVVDIGVFEFGLVVVGIGVEGMGYIIDIDLIEGFVGIGEFAEIEKFVVGVGVGIDTVDFESIADSFKLVNY